MDIPALNNTAGSPPYQLNPKISGAVFRAYDIRAVVDDSFSENEAYTIARAFASWAKERGRHTLLVASDGRLTSPRLLQAVTTGFRESGCDVLVLGEVPTPLLYFATKTEKTDTGIIVTASHNPKEYNGFKLVFEGQTLLEKGIKELYQRCQKGPFQQGKGRDYSLPMISKYQQYLLENMVIPRSLKVVVDCGNGIAGPVVLPLLRQLGVDVIPLFPEVDGSFPNHHPDPSEPAHLEDLIRVVLEEKADLGLAFDGDADRLGVISNSGQIIWPDRLMMLFAVNVLKENPGCPIIFDVKSSRELERVIKAHGGIPVISRTGHSLVKSKIFEIDAKLAGEMSGHIFFHDKWFGFDDAIYAACRLLSYVAHEEKTLDEMFECFPNLACTPEMKIPVDDAAKFYWMEQIVSELHFPDAKRVTIDGVRVEFKEGWGLVRASNTSPCLVLRFEAENAASLSSIQRRIKEALFNINPAFQIPF